MVVLNNFRIFKDNDSGYSLTELVVGKVSSCDGEVDTSVDFSFTTPPVTETSAPTANCWICGLP